MASELPEGAAEALRIAIATALIQSGWFDSGGDEGPDEGDLLQWHGCQSDCARCSCSGVPFLSDLIWSKMDVFGDLTKAVAHIERAMREKVAQEIEAHGPVIVPDAYGANPIWRQIRLQHVAIARGSNPEGEGA